jgi:hypothetical protein
MLGERPALRPLVLANELYLQTPGRVVLAEARGTPGSTFGRIQQGAPNSCHN